MQYRWLWCDVESNSMISVKRDHKTGVWVERQHYQPLEKISFLWLSLVATVFGGVLYKYWINTIFVWMCIRLLCTHAQINWKWHFSHISGYYLSFISHCHRMNVCPSNRQNNCIDNIHQTRWQHPAQKSFSVKKGQWARRAIHTISGNC